MASMQRRKRPKRKKHDGVSTNSSESYFIPVTCGEEHGILHTDKFFCPGLTRQCIEYKGAFITPSNLIAEAYGASSHQELRRWKQYVSVTGQDCLGRFMEEGLITFKDHASFCTMECMDFDCQRSMIEHGSGQSEQASDEDVKKELVFKTEIDELNVCDDLATSSVMGNVEMLGSMKTEQDPLSIKTEPASLNAKTESAPFVVDANCDMVEEGCTDYGLELAGALDFKEEFPQPVIVGLVGNADFSVEDESESARETVPEMISFSSEMNTVSPATEVPDTLSFQCLSEESLQLFQQLHNIKQALLPALLPDPQKAHASDNVETIHDVHQTQSPALVVSNNFPSTPALTNTGGQLANYLATVPQSVVRFPDDRTVKNCPKRVSALSSYLPAFVARNNNLIVRKYRYAPQPVIVHHRRTLYALKSVKKEHASYIPVISIDDSAAQTSLKDSESPFTYQLLFAAGSKKTDVLLIQNKYTKQQYLVNFLGGTVEVQPVKDSCTNATAGAFPKKSIIMTNEDKSDQSQSAHCGSNKGQNGNLSSTQPVDSIPYKEYPLKVECSASEAENITGAENLPQGMPHSNNQGPAGKRVLGNSDQVEDTVQAPSVITSETGLKSEQMCSSSLRLPYTSAAVSLAVSKSSQMMCPAAQSAGTARTKPVLTGNKTIPTTGDTSTALPPSHSPSTSMGIVSVFGTSTTAGTTTNSASDSLVNAHTVTDKPVSGTTHAAVADKTAKVSTLQTRKGHLKQNDACALTSESAGQDSCQVHKGASLSHGVKEKDKYNTFDLMGSALQSGLVQNKEDRMSVLSLEDADILLLSFIIANAIMRSCNSFSSAERQVARAKTDKDSVVDRYHKFLQMEKWKEFCAKFGVQQLDKYWEDVVYSIQSGENLPPVDKKPACSAIPHTVSEKSTTECSDKDFWIEASHRGLCDKFLVNTVKTVMDLHKPLSRGNQQEACVMNNALRELGLLSKFTKLMQHKRQNEELPAELQSFDRFGSGDLEVLSLLMNGNNTERDVVIRMKRRDPNAALRNRRVLMKTVQRLSVQNMYSDSKRDMESRERESAQDVFSDSCGIRVKEAEVDDQASERRGADDSAQGKPSLHHIKPAPPKSLAWLAKQAVHALLSTQNMEEELRDKICSTLTKLEGEHVDVLIQHLKDTVGVKEPDDLAHVTKDDLCLPFMTPIMIRKLICSWATPAALSPLPTSPVPPRSLQAAASLSAAASPDSSPSIQLPTSSGPRRGWANDFLVNWDQVHLDTVNRLRGREVIRTSQRQELVRCLVAQIHRVCPNPLKKDFSTIAHRICAEFSSLRDTIDGDIIGSGHDGLMWQLITRSENVRRGRTASGSRRRRQLATADSSEQTASLKRTRDSYGCIAFAPILRSDEEERQADKKARMQLEGASDNLGLFSDSYSLQRKEILQGKTASDLLKEWPLFFTERGLSIHFSHLTGVDETKFDENLLNRAPKVLGYFCNGSPKGKEAEILAEWRSEGIDNSIHLDTVAIVLLLLSRFGEKKENLIVLARSSCTKETIDRASLPSVPVVVCCGETPFRCTRHMLAVDGMIVNENIGTFPIAIRMLFQCYYCLNIQYAQDCGATLEFLQRFFFGINPDRGTKLSSRKKYDIHPKVLTLTNSIAAFGYLH